MIKTSLKKILVSSLSWFVFAGLLSGFNPCLMKAQKQNIRFKHLTIDDGLSHSWVHSICQDRYGFIWIGTDDGLDRYDGYNFRIYKKELHTHYSINSSNIWNLFEDSKGNLLIGTGEGLSLYDRQNDRFILNPKWPQNAINSIGEDAQNNLWIGTSDGLYRIDLRNDSVDVFTRNNNLQDRSHLSNNSIGTVIVDRRNNIWIGTRDGLNLYDKEKNSFINYYHDNNNSSSLMSNDIRSILEDKTGRLWIGTDIGLDVFTNAQDRPRKGTFVHYQNNVNDQNSISLGAVLSLLEDDKQNLWIGIENGGLDIFKLDTSKKGANSFIHFKNDPNNSTSLSNNSIYSLYKDKQQNIWIGTFGNGINIMNSVEDKFIHVLSEPGNKNSLINKQVNTFLEDNDFLWIGTEGGLDRYNKKDDTFTHFIHNPLDKKSIGSNAVWALCKDKLGNLWIGTWDGGLNKFDYKTETFEHYYHDPGDTSSLGSNNIFAIHEDRDGNLWIGTMGGGLNIFDRKKKIFIRYDNTNSGIYSNYVSSIVETKNGDLWLANAVSFERFDRVTKKFEHFMHSANDSTSLSSNKATSNFEDSKGNIWMGTDAGLDLYRKSINGFKHYRKEDGLPDNSINSILEDNRGNLWLGTNKGLAEFIDAVNIPTMPKFRNFTYEDGLQSNGFNRRSCLKGAGGVMYFGGTNGFNVLNPDRITKNTYIPPIVITDFQIFNKPVSIGDKGLKKDKGGEELVLTSKQSVFSFDFASLNYISSAKNEYAYKMEGFDEDWNYIGTKHTVTYTNLDPGKYVFRVKGSNNDGVWNEEGVALPIVITPPFWLSLWFRMLLVIAVAGIVFWIYRWRVQARDLASQKKMDAALAKERNLLRTVIDNLPDAIYAKDLQCRKTLSNRIDFQYMGFASESEVLGKDAYELFAKELADGIITDDRAVIQTGQPVIEREEYIIDGNGKKHFLLTSKLPLRNEQNQIVGLIGIGRDITEHRKIEEALRNEKALLDALLDNVPDSIYFKDRQSRHIRINRKEMLDLNITEMSQIFGKTDVDLWGEELGRRTMAEEQQLLETGVPIIGEIEKRQRADGSVIWTSTTKVPIRDVTGQISGLVGITREVTELMKVQAERERLITELQDALADVKLLSGLVPICASCKKIRDDQGYWTQIESYIQDRSDAKFSHSICPDCAAKLYPGYNLKK
jgi:PAS domain S-box-containing protein